MPRATFPITQTAADAPHRPLMRLPATNEQVKEIQVDDTVEIVVRGKVVGANLGDEDTRVDFSGDFEIEVSETDIYRVDEKTADEELADTRPRV